MIQHSKHPSSGDVSHTSTSKTDLTLKRRPSFTRLLSTHRVFSLGFTTDETIGRVRPRDSATLRNPEEILYKSTAVATISNQATEKSQHSTAITPEQFSSISAHARSGYILDQHPDPVRSPPTTTHVHTGDGNPLRSSIETTVSVPSLPLDNSSLPPKTRRRWRICPLGKTSREVRC